ncbi:MAG: type II toxin-antitoxin system Phd/YefM family antitoxin [Clostridiales bacterium]|nr:type II toxin-antitoxin system Phd/YefM family antitoxin [Clostridiales bacterium]
MSTIIKSSSELRKNYNSIAEICRTYKTPVFLTRNGAGDTVIMDMDTYNRREEDLATAERLLAAERSRLMGTRGYTKEEFEKKMREAIRLVLVDDIQDCRQDEDKSILERELMDEKDEGYYR